MKLIFKQQRETFASISEIVYLRFAAGAFGYWEIVSEIDKMFVEN